MKKNVLALSIAAMIGGLGFAGSASAALAVNESDTGHMLLVPYYTAQNGNMTVLHVVNTDTSNGKAMKVRFRGAANSDDVLDFQVFLSPADVWTAAISAGANGVATLTTYDGSCTLPAIAKGVAVPFVQDRLPSTMTAADKASNTREGYVEMFNMADIDSTANYTNPSTGLTGRSALYTATKHVGGVAPCTDAVMQGTLAWDHTTATTTSGLKAPSSGLTGSWYIINVPQTTTFSGAAAAIASYGTAVTTKNVFSAQSTGGPALLSADPLFKAGFLTAQKYDLPDLSTPYDSDFTTAEQQAIALNTALAKSQVINQYANDASISAKTDWVFSMPTRRYSIAANYAAPISQSVVSVTSTTAPAAGDATTKYRVINGDVTGSYFVTSTNTTVNTIGQICAAANSVTFYDREETFRTSGAVFSPGTATTTSLCGEVSVLSFADAGASALGATVARSNVTGVYTNGWGRIGFSAPVPVLGASFMKVSNPNATPGVSGNYGITWPHAYKGALQGALQ